MSAAPAFAQDQRKDDLQSFYTLWGIMEGSTGACTEVTGNSAFGEALAGWKARTQPVLEEMETLRDALGIGVSFAEDSATEGSNGIGKMIREAPNRDEACRLLLSNLADGWYEAEYYLAEQLARLRERGGM